VKAFAAALSALLVASIAHAHSASDAYLTLTAASPQRTSAVIDAQWDIALRDLDFVLGLDDDGDGNLTWGEVRKHQAAIARYAYEHLRASGDGTPCSIEPARQAIADRADGAYAALFLRIVCRGAPRKVTIDYRLFFAVDPSHRGILVFRSIQGTATSLISPDNARIELRLD